MTVEAIVVAAANFKSCLETLWPEAESRDISRATFDDAVAELSPDLRIIDILDAQSEFTEPIWIYVDHVLQPDRIEPGRAMLTKYEPTFAEVEKAYGVDRAIVAAIWGVETNYGAQTGNFPVLRSIATLACIGRRQSYFRQQFVAALSIMERDEIRLDLVQGSWSGAFGQNQMMPSSFQAFAIDFDGDGRRDIVGSPADVLGSTAYYLKRSGWAAGQRWGLEVSLPEGFDYRVQQTEQAKPLSEWRALGVVRAGGEPLAGNVGEGSEASLLLPAGAAGPAFLIFDNFRVIFSYNPSDSYVLAVGLLSDQLSGYPAVRHPWPRDERMLTGAERLELQRHLVTFGYDIGGAPNGRIRADTRRAISKFQASIGIVADGFPSERVLERMRIHAQQNR